MLCASLALVVFLWLMFIYITQVNISAQDGQKNVSIRGLLLLDLIFSVC